MKLLNTVCLIFDSLYRDLALGQSYCKDSLGTVLENFMGNPTLFEQH